MNQKNLSILAIIVVVLGAGYYFYQNNQAVAPTTEEVGNQANIPAESENKDAAPSESPAAGAEQPKKPNTPSQGTFSSGEDPGEGVDIQVVEVSYDGTQFTPGTVNIKVNDYVIFRNKSSVDFWPASAPHPAHTDYLEFDAKKAVSAGGKYQFQFQKPGNWKYHDHLNPTIYGAVNVTAR